jgi:membrane-associated phospholipid phosphatase
MHPPFGTLIQFVVIKNRSDRMITSQRTAVETRFHGLRRRTLLNIAVISLLLGAIVLSFSAAGSGTLPGDIAITRSIQRIQFGPIETLADLMNWLGSTSHVVAIGGICAVALFLVRRRHQALLLVISLVLTGISIPLLKGEFASPRPTSVDVTVSSVNSGWGFPSGHVIGSTLLFGTLWYLIARSDAPRSIRRATQIIAPLLILLSGFSRIYVGAHWPSDVLGGYLWGGLLLTAIIGFAESRRLRSGESR